MKQNKSHFKSKFSTVVIGVLFGIYTVGYGSLCLLLYQNLEQPLLLLFGLIPLVLGVAMIAVVKMRMKEIKKGELDDAQKY